jgi:putative ABC transport system substrate-binding protein
VRRRDFIKVIANSAATTLPWPLATRAQQYSLPVIGFLDNGYSKRIPELMPAFFRGLAENGFVESRNVIIEYRTAEGDDRVYPAMAEDLVRRGVAVMVTVGGVSATMAAKAATNSPMSAFGGKADIMGMR